MTTEATLRAAVLKRLRADYYRASQQVLVFGRPASAATGPGHPDLFGVAAGRFFALEIKVLNAKPTPLQVQRIKDLREAGACAWIVRSPTEASKAVYQCKKGATVMTDAPIDFDDWFKDLVATPAETPTASVATRATPSTEADSAALEAAFDLEAEAAVHPEPSPAALAAMPEVAPEKQKRARRGKFAAAATPEPAPEPTPFDNDVAKPTVNDLQDARDAGLLGIQMPDPGIQAQADTDQSLAYLVELVKAVGDRVTIVYEEVNNVKQGVIEMAEVLLGMAAVLKQLRADMDVIMEDES